MGERDAFISPCYIQVLDVDSSFAATGSPRRLTPLLRTNAIAWSPDGKFLIYDVWEKNVSYLWRIGVNGESPPERIDAAGADASSPAVSRAGNRLAFSRRLKDDHIYRFEPGRFPTPVARSSAYDGNVQFSPDGRRIAFCSARSDNRMEVWVADADGYRPRATHTWPRRMAM